MSQKKEAKMPMIQLRNAQIPLDLWGAILRLRNEKRVPGHVVRETLQDAIKILPGDLENAIEYEEKRKKRIARDNGWLLEFMLGDTLGDIDQEAA